MKYQRIEVVEAFQYDGDFMNSDGVYYIPDWAVKAYEAGLLSYSPLDDMPYELFLGEEWLEHVPVGNYIVMDEDGVIGTCGREEFENKWKPVLALSPLLEQEHK